MMEIHPSIDLYTPKRLRGIADVVIPNGSGYGSVEEVPANIDDAVMLGAGTQHQPDSHTNPIIENTVVAQQLEQEEKQRWTNDLKTGMLAFLRRDWPNKPDRNLATNTHRSAFSLENIVLSLPHLNYHLHRRALDEEEPCVDAVLREYFLAGAITASDVIPGDENSHRPMVLHCMADEPLSNIWGTGVCGTRHLHLVIKMVEVGPETTYTLSVDGRQIVRPGNYNEAGKYTRYVPQVVPVSSAYRRLELDKRTPHPLAYTMNCETYHGVALYVGLCTYNMNTSRTPRPDAPLSYDSTDSPVRNVRALATAEVVGLRVATMTREI